MMITYEIFYHDLTEEAPQKKKTGIVFHLQ